jgi:Coiled-coil domain-containing protein 55 (DUF2040)
MNINLSKAATKKKKGYALGLNARGATAVNAFGGGDASSDEERPAAGRDAVNRAIAKEQAALRARAAAAAADGNMNPLYDYDGAYDSFHPDTKKKEQAKVDSKESRYIGDLLKAAEQRKQERDIAHERKVAREQAAEEEADPEVRGKEQFVTAAYKRKLEERKVWHEQEEKQRKIDDENDVTKRTDGVGMASFYGNLNKNVAMGGGVTISEKKKTSHSDGDDPRLSHDDATSDLGFLDGFAKGDGGDIQENATDTNKNVEPTALSQPEAIAINDKEVAEDPAERQKRIRLIREKKVEGARARYFQRQGMTVGKQ